MASQDKSLTGWETAKAMHEKLRQPCKKLLESGCFEYRRQNQPWKVLNALCDSPKPMSRREIVSRCGIAAESVTTVLGRLRVLFSSIKSEYREALSEISGLSVSKAVAAPNSDRRKTTSFLNLPSLSPEEAQKRAQASMWKAVSLGGKHATPTFVLPMDRLLEPDVEEPDWFRDGGPLWADFEDGRVPYSTDELARIHQRLIDHSGLLLEGDRGSGKSVLVRAFAYQYQNAMPIYYMSFKLEEKFAFGEFVRELDSLQGLIILEDAHLAPDYVSLVLQRVSADFFRRILVTALSGFRDSLSRECPANRAVLQLPVLHTRPEERVDDIVRTYSTRQGLHLTPWNRAQMRQEASEGDLWVLARALEGYTVMGGAGEPKDWIEAAVNSDLEQLRNIDPVLPRVILALAPLSRFETPATERFLLTELPEFGIAEASLNRMALRTGKIKCQNGIEHTYYSLRHAGLAEVYWKHSMRYRNDKALPSDGEIILRYLRSNSPNALSLIARMDVTSVYEYILKREDFRSLLPGLLANESSLQHILQWLRQPWSLRYITDKVLHILTTRAQIAGTALLSFQCVLKICQLFAEGEQLCLQDGMVKKLSRELPKLDVNDMVNILSNLFLTAPNLASQVWKKTNKQDVRNVVFEDAKPTDASKFLANFKRRQPSLAKSISNLVTAEQLANKVKAATSCRDIMRLFNAFLMIEPNKAARAADLSKDSVKYVINMSDSPLAVCQCIAAMCRADKNTGIDVFENTYEERIAQPLASLSNLPEISSCVAALHSGSDECAIRLCDKLQLEKIAFRLSTGKKPGPLRLLLDIFSGVDPNRARSMAKAVDVDQLARTAEDWSCVEMSRHAYWLHKADEKVGRAFCKAIGCERIVDSLCVGSHDEVVEALLILHRTERDWARKAWAEYVETLQNDKRPWPQAGGMEISLTISAVVTMTASLLSEIAKVDRHLTEDLLSKIPDEQLRHRVERALDSAGS
jgi:hypothetical protein